MMVVSSTENSGINATMNAHEISAFMAKSLRLRAEVKERVGLNLSKSMTERRPSAKRRYLRRSSHTRFLGELTSDEVHHEGNQEQDQAVPISTETPRSLASGYCAAMFAAMGPVREACSSLTESRPGYHEHGHRLAERTTEAEHGGGHDAGLAERQDRELDHFPLRGAEGQSRLFLKARGLQEMSRDMEVMIGRIMTASTTDTVATVRRDWRRDRRTGMQ